MFGIQGLSLDIDLLVRIQWLACQTEYNVQGASDHVYHFFLVVLAGVYTPENPRSRKSAVLRTVRLGLWQVQPPSLADRKVQVAASPLPFLRHTVSQLN